MNNAKLIPRNKALLKTLTLLTIFSIPLCGTIGLFILLASLLLSLGIVAALSPQKPLKYSLQHIKQHHSIAYYAGLLWLCFTLFSLVFVFFEETTNMRKFAGLGRQLYILLEIGFALVLISQINRNIIQANTVFITLAAGFFSLVSYQGLAIYSIPIQENSFWSWTPLMAANIRDTGTIACAITVVFFCLSLTEQRRKQCFIFTVITTLSWTYLMWSGGRTGNAAVILVFLIFSLLQLAFAQQKLKGLIIGLFTGFLAFNLCNQLAVYDWNGFQRIENKFSENILTLSNEEQSTEADPNAQNHNSDSVKRGHRKIMWANAWQAFKRAPLIGLGPNGWFFSPEREASGAVQDQPHNIFLQTLVEWGVIGSILFFTMLIALVLPRLKYLVKAFKKKDATYLSAASMILVLSLHSLTSGTYWNFQSVSVVVIAYSIWISWKYKPV